MNEEDFLKQLDERLEDLTEKRASFKACIYGHSGVGKTVAAMELAKAITPKDKAILHIDSGQGWVSLNNHPHLKQGVKSFKIRGISEFDLLASAIERDAGGKWGKVGCIVIDELSTYAAYDVLAVTASRAKKDPGKNPDEPKLPDMGVSSNRMKRFMGPLISLPNTHVIFVSHQRVDDVNARKVISPAFMPAFNSHFMGLLHLVGHMTAEEVMETGGQELYKREVQVQPTGQIVAKTRVGGYSGIRVDIPEMIQGAKEWLEGKREDVQKQEVKTDDREHNSDSDQFDVDDLISTFEG